MKEQSEMWLDQRVEQLEAEVKRLRAEIGMYRESLTEAREYGDRWRAIANER